MNQRAAETGLSLAYSIAVAMGATSSITSGIAWGHWKDTLNQCVDLNYEDRETRCSCILYAKHTPKYFLGGDVSNCVWVTFGPLIYVLFCVGLACFHGFRIMFGSRISTRSLPTKNENGETIIMQVQTETISQLPRAYWIAASIFSTFFAAYGLVHFSFYTHGYYTTCKQYRQTLIQELGIHGTIIPAVHGRLACNAIFDFMDYIQPDTGNAYRDGFINTAASLIIGIITSWFAFLAFVYAAVITTRFARIKTGITMKR